MPSYTPEAGVGPYFFVRI